jgi:hypothetical protein
LAAGVAGDRFSSIQPRRIESMATPGDQSGRGDFAFLGVIFGWRAYGGC